MTKYYFFKSKRIGAQIKIVPIDNQKFTDGSEVNSTLNCQCKRDGRDEKPIGTIFWSTSLELSSTRKFYRVKGPLEYLSPSSPSEVTKAYSIVPGIDLKTVPKTPVTVFEKISACPELSAPTSKKDGFFMEDSDWKILVRNCQKQVNTMIVGPTGSGKTSCVKEVAKRMGLDLHIFDMGSMIDPISSLLGVHRLEEGHSIFDMAKFTQVIQTPCIILLDELNRSSVASNNVLFPCLDDRRELNIEIAGSKDIRSIKVHPGVTFIATANIGTEYTGTMSMDRALMNRFFALELGCISCLEESNVIQKRADVSKKTADMIVKVADNIRSMATRGDISTSLSIRETLMVSSLVSDGWDLGQAMELVYLPLFEGTKSEGERSVISKLILTY